MQPSNEQYMQALVAEVLADLEELDIDNLAANGFTVGGFPVTVPRTAPPEPPAPPTPLPLPAVPPTASEQQTPSDQSETPPSSDSDESSSSLPPSTDESSSSASPSTDDSPGSVQGH
jgi:hypothetical protein